MARDFPRARRVGEQMQRELAELLRLHVTDNSFQLLSCTAVEVSKDLGVADVYVSALGDREVASQAAEMLAERAGFFRSELGRRMTIRAVPVLRFKADTSIVDGMTMSTLIDKARNTDREKGEQPEDDAAAED